MSPNPGWTSRSMPRHQRPRLDPVLLVCRSVMDHRRVLLLSILYQLVRCLLDLIAVLVHEIWVRMRSSWCCGTRTPCCADRSPGSATRPSTGCGWLLYLACCRADAGPRPFRSVRRRPGRPPTAPAIKKLVIRMVTVNPTWGHRLSAPTIRRTSSSGPASACGNTSRYGMILPDGLSHLRSGVRATGEAHRSANATAPAVVT